LADKDKIVGSEKPGTVVSDYEQHRGLINACLSGDRAAQKELYNMHSPVLFGIIRRYIDDRNACQEILSDTFLKIFTKLHMYSFNGAFEGWMRRIAVNTVTDYVRKNMKHQQTISTDATSVDIYVPDNAVSKLSYKELLQFVHELPHTQRAVFNLFVFDDMQHKDIAEQLNITEPNSRWHLNDARRRLKEKISKQK
jgi:RNA polymerase sigma factor (sigma-70 family)